MMILTHCKIHALKNTQTNTPPYSLIHPLAPPTPRIPIPPLSLYFPRATTIIFSSSQPEPRPVIFNAGCLYLKKKNSNGMRTYVFLPSIDSQEWKKNLGIYPLPEFITHFNLVGMLDQIPRKMLRYLMQNPVFIHSSMSSSATTMRTSTYSQSLLFFSSAVEKNSFPPHLSSEPALNEDVDTVFHTLTTSETSVDLQRSLKSAAISIPFTVDLIDKVMKRVRFSHSNPLQALEFFKFTSQKRGFFHSAFSFNTMLYVLGRNRKFEHIWGLLLEMKRKDRCLITTKTVQVVLGRIAKVCSVRETVESFKKFRKLVPEFDTKCYNALLRALCEEKSMSDARNVYHSLKHGFKPNLQTFNILLSGWKSAEEAEAFFEEMKEMGVESDIVSYNCLVDCYCKNREMEKVYRLLEEMRKQDISPDVITYTSLIGGLGLVGQPDKARDVLKEMREYGCYPDVAAYNAAIRNFCIAKRILDAYGLIDEMVKKGLSPNATTYNVFLRSFFWCNDLTSSWSLYQRMKKTGCLPNTQSCMFLIRLIRRHEKVEMALELWNDMVEKGFGSFTLVSDILFGLLCDLGKLEEAERSFLQMVEKRQKPSKVSLRRIKVLMELANKQEALCNLTEKMESFGGGIQVPRN